VNTTIRFVTASAALTFQGIAGAQESAAGNAVAEQLAQSSLRMVGSLLAVLTVVAVCSWCLRRWRDRQNVSNESIEIISGLSLGSKDKVVLLRVGDEQVLVGVGPAGMQSLHVIQQPSVGGRSQVAVAQSDSAVDTAVTAKPLPPAFNLSMGAAQ